MLRVHCYTDEELHIIPTDLSYRKVKLQRNTCAIPLNYLRHYSPIYNHKKKKITCMRRIIVAGFLEIKGISNRFNDAQKNTADVRLSF